MKQVFPQFIYHPNPLGTGAVEVADKVCVCCGENRGYLYVGPVYGPDDLHDSLCPWCIADGSAAAKLDASFGDDHALSVAGLAPDIIEAVNLRTPGYSSWQSEQWLSHCDDACEFHGDATVAEVQTASAETKASWMREYQLNEDDWILATRGYVPRGHSAFYKFVCRHCHAVLFGWDCS